MRLLNICDIEDTLNSAGISVNELYRIYNQRQPVPERIVAKASGKSAAEERQIPWLQENLSLALLFTKRALENEEFLLVCDVAREAIRCWTGTDLDQRTQIVRIRMNYAAALTRLGFTREAREELEPCVADGFEPRLGRGMKAEILVQLGNNLRDESLNTAARAVRLRTAHEALDFYKRALALDPNRIDALALSAGASMVIGEPGSALREEARQTAEHLIELTAKMEDFEGPRTGIMRARTTAHALLGDVEAVAESYRQLQTTSGVTTKDLADARYYATFLAEASGKPRDFFKKAFPPLQLVVFSGHAADLPGMPQRFPVESIEQVRREIRDKLEEMGARVALVSASAGADLLFVEAMLERKGTVHLVLPWSREDFRNNSIRPYEPPGMPPIWEPLFDRALNESATIRAMGQAYEPASDVGWAYMTEVAAGLALHTARASRMDVQPLVLWDGQTGRGADGTASFYQFWRDELKQTPQCIHLPATASPGEPHHDGKRSARSETPTIQQKVKTMLFADIVGYSKLPEQTIPDFIETFMGRVSQLLGSSRHAPRSVNTWGDGLYAIFDFTRDAGLFALELTQMVLESRCEWLAKGLYVEAMDVETQQVVKWPLNIRIGLHTGPVFMHYDPVVRRLGFTGAHVSRAARIEPIAQPGEVFASEEFAALAELDAEIHRKRTDQEETEHVSFVCEYAGSKQLAKDYPGWFRIYRVVPRRTFAIEELAKAAHELYLNESRARGETREKNAAMRPWEELPEDLKQANRAQVGDIPNKLRALGYELAPGYGLPASEIKITDAKLESLAIREHDRWMKDRLSQGWVYAPRRDNSRKHHNLLIPWEQLSEPEKEKDRDTVKNLPRLIERAGFRVTKL